MASSSSIDRVSTGTPYARWPTASQSRGRRDNKPKRALVGLFPSQAPLPPPAAAARTYRRRSVSPASSDEQQQIESIDRRVDAVLRVPPVPSAGSAEYVLAQLLERRPLVVPFVAEEHGKSKSCAICLEPVFANAMFVPCGHRCCEICLEAMLQSSLVNSSSGQLSCHICRTPVVATGRDHG